MIITYLDLIFVKVSYFLSYATFLAAKNYQIFSYSVFCLHGKTVWVHSIGVNAQQRLEKDHITSKNMEI